MAYCGKLSDRRNKIEKYIELMVCNLHDKGLAAMLNDANKGNRLALS